MILNILFLLDQDGIAINIAIKLLVISTKVNKRGLYFLGFDIVVDMDLKKFFDTVN